jgi:serine/threonine protein phosphatase PrpC
MEDMSLVKHELRVTCKFSVSFYAVFDGHGTRDCVKYVHSNLEEKLRDYIINSPPLDL